MQSPESISQGPKGNLTLGPCRFEGIFDCPCPRGTAYELVKDIKLDLPCSGCGHPLSIHHDDNSEIIHVKMGSPVRLKVEQEPASNNFQDFNTLALMSSAFDSSLTTLSSTPAASHHESRQLPILNGPIQLPDPSILICERQQTVSQILSLLDTRRSVFIWGMPGSGKTMLAYLLCKHISSTFDKVIIIENWPADTTQKMKKPEEVLLEHARLKFPDVSAEDLQTQDFIFLVDEAQETLRKQKAGWNTLLKNSVSSTDATKKGPRFCLFSDQGMFAENGNVFATMAEISYLTTHGNGTGCASLFFTAPEFEDVIEQNRALRGLVLSKEASDHIFWLTGGHPFITRLILEYVNAFYEKAPFTLRSTASIASVSRADVQAILHDDIPLFNYIGPHMYPGQFPRENNVAIKVFKKLLSAPEGKIFWQAQYSTIGKCFVNGLICHEINDDDTDVFKFPSPLHARWAQWYHKIEPGVYAGEFTP